MVCNFSNMLKAPKQNHEVAMRRKHTTNEVQNARQKIAYVRAHDEAEAKMMAETLNPEFKAGKTRRV